MSSMDVPVSPYRSKVVVVLISDPLTPENQGVIRDWILEGGGNATLLPDGYDVAMVVHTDSGSHDAPYGWRIVRGTRNEHYPLTPEAFADKYEES